MDCDIKMILYFRLMLTIYLKTEPTSRKKVYTLLITL